MRNVHIFYRETRYIGIRKLKCKIDCKRYIAEEIRNKVPADKAMFPAMARAWIAHYKFP